MPAVSNISSVRYDHKTPNFQPQPSHIRSISNSDVSMKSSPHRRVLSELSPNVSRTTPTGTTKAAVFDKQSPSQKKPALNCLLENSSSPLRTEKSNSSHQDIIGPRTDAARNSRNGAIRKRTIDEVDNPEGRKICHLAVKERTLEVSLSHTERVKSIEVPDKEPSSSATTNKSHGTSFSSIINYEASTGEDDDNTTSATLPTIVESIASEDENMQVATSAKEQAKNLRLRLRVAMFKVRTNQTQVPLADLKVKDSAATASKNVSASFTSSTSSVPVEPAVSISTLTSGSLSKSS